MRASTLVLIAIVAAAALNAASAVPVDVSNQAVELIPTDAENGVTNRLIVIKAPEDQTADQTDFQISGTLPTGVTIYQVTNGAPFLCDFDTEITLDTDVPEAVVVGDGGPDTEYYHFCIRFTTTEDDYTRDGQVDLTVTLFDGVNVPSASPGVFTFEYAALCATIPTIDSGATVIDTIDDATFDVVVTGDNQISFTIDASYVRENTIPYLSFFPFAAGSTEDILRGTASTYMCGNFYGADLTGESLDSEPNALFPAGTGTGNSATQWPTSSRDWSRTSTGCGTVQYTRIIDFATLIACRGSGPTDNALTAGVSSGGQPSYTGELYLHYVTPTNPGDLSTSSFLVQTSSVPFEFLIQANIEDVAVLNPTNGFDAVVLNLRYVPAPDGDDAGSTAGTEWQDIDTDVFTSNDLVPSTDGGIMLLELFTTIDTSLANSLALDAEPSAVDAGLIAGDNNLALGHEDGNVCPDGTDACTAVWRCYITQASEGTDFFDGAYTFTWTDALNSGQTYTLTVTVSLTAANVLDNAGTIDIPNNLYVSADADNARFVNPDDTSQDVVFTSGQTIHVRHAIEPANAADETTFQFDLTNAWVCSTLVSGYTVTLAGASDGCRTEIPGVLTTAGGDIVQLYTDGSGALVNDLYDVDYRNPEDMFLIDGDFNRNSNGLTFNAQALQATGRNGPFYLHWQSTISQFTPVRRDGESRGTMKVDALFRRDVSDSNRASMNTISLQESSVSSSSSDGSSTGSSNGSSSSVAGPASIAGVSAVVGLAALVVAGKRRRDERRELVSKVTDVADGVSRV